MRYSFVAGLSFVASALAIQVTSPQTGADWTVVGPNQVAWSSVNTDPTAFQIVLVNPDSSVTDNLAADVSTSLGSYTVTAPSGGFPVGQMWRINLIPIPGSTGSGILAQSGYFNITSGSSTLSGTTTSGVAPSTLSGLSTATTHATTTTAAALTTPATGTSVVQSTATDLNPTGKSGALGSFQVSGAAAFLALVAGVHAFVL